MSWIGVLNHQRASMLKAGFPSHRCRKGIAPGATAPFTVMLPNSKPPPKVVVYVKGVR